MSIRVHVGGQICGPEAARVSVFDRGFLYGDSVYETAATVKGHLFALPEHLDRLERSAARIGLPLPQRAYIETAIADTVAAAGNSETRVRIMVTRGVGALDLDPGAAERPELVIIAMPRNGPSPAMYDAGVAVQVVSITRNHPAALDPAVKSGNYLNNVLALGEARRLSGAHEAILCAANGGVAEGASSNVFLVKGGELLTPALSVGILDGITRHKVLALAVRNGIATREADFIAPEELASADELFLTSAVRGVLPVTRVRLPGEAQDRSIGPSAGAGRPGPITQRLRALYEAAAEAEARNAATVRTVTATATETGGKGVSSK